MTRWERFYRWIGGQGPDDPVRATGLRERFASRVAWALLDLGFLYRDATLRGAYGTWFVNYLWQWRFWRGPYWAVLPGEKYRIARILAQYR